MDEVGALTPNIQVNVDINKMTAAQVGYNDIIQAIGNENVIFQRGNDNKRWYRHTIDIKGDFKSGVK